MTTHDSTPLWTVAALVATGGAALRWNSTRNRELRRENRRLRQQAVDTVAELPIRAVWEAEASALLDAAPERAVLVLADLDDFKSINDRHGHPAGDDVLREVAGRLQAVFTDAVISRLGGDEFAVLATDLALPADLDCFTSVMNSPFPVSSTQQVRVTASLGIVECGSLPAPVTLTAALQAADHSLYAAKRTTRRHSEPRESPVSALHPAN